MPPRKEVLQSPLLPILQRNTVWGSHTIYHDKPRLKCSCLQWIWRQLGGRQGDRKHERVMFNTAHTWICWPVLPIPCLRVISFSPGTDSLQKVPQKVISMAHIFVRPHIADHCVSVLIKICQRLFQATISGKSAEKQETDK